MDAGSGEHGIILAFFGGARKVVCGKVVRAAVSRLGSRPVGARRPRLSRTPRGCAGAGRGLGVRDLVEVDLGECATVNAWVNGERLTLLLGVTYCN